MSEAAAPVNHMASLYKKLAAVMGAMKRVSKEGRNDFHRYTYATAADVADAIRGELASRDIAFFAEMVDAQIADGVWVVEFEFTFACGETGATVAKRWRSEAQAMTSKGRDDKGLNKAATAAEKYFLLKTFIVSTGDEPDPDADGDTPRQKQAAPKAEAVGTRHASSDAPTSPSPDKPQMGFTPSNAKQWSPNEAIAWANKWGAQGLTQVDVLAALGVERLSAWTKGETAADTAVKQYIDSKVQA